MATACREESGDRIGVWCAQQRRVVRPTEGLIKERAFKVGAEDEPILLCRIGDNGEAGLQIGLAGCDEREHDACRPVAVVEVQRGPDAFHAIVEGRTAPAVTVDVDEARGEPAARGIRHPVGVDAQRLPARARSDSQHGVRIEGHPGIRGCRSAGDEAGRVDDGACSSHEATITSIAFLPNTATCPGVTTASVMALPRAQRATRLNPGPRFAARILRWMATVSYTHLRAHETDSYLV